MKTFWTWIREIGMRVAEAWNLARRDVVFVREGEQVYFAVVARRRGKWLVEHAEKTAPSQLERHPVLRRVRAFPRVLFTRFGAALRLDQALLQEWPNTLRDRRKVRKVLPMEVGSRLPFTANNLLFDCVAGGREGETTSWQVACAFRDEVRSELDFWFGHGVELDFLEWEGNLVGQLVRRLSRDTSEPQIWLEEEEKVTHLVAAARGAWLAHRVILNPSVEERRKRVRVAFHELEQKGIEAAATAPRLALDRLPIDFPGIWEARPRRLLGALAFRAVGELGEGMNFLRGLMLRRAAGAMLLKKIPAAATTLLVVLGAAQLLMGFEKIELGRTLREQVRQKEAAVREISRKTGLSEGEVLLRRGQILAGKSGSVLRTLAEAAEQLAQATGPAYRGHRLEIASGRLSLEGETGSFLELQKIQDRLADAAALGRVELISSQERDGRVYFEIAAEREAQ